MKRIYILSRKLPAILGALGLLALGGCALVPEYDTPISEKYEERKEERKEEQ